MFQTAFPAIEVKQSSFFRTSAIRTLWTITSGIRSEKSQIATIFCREVFDIPFVN
jgi:hypothetical protein